MSLLWDYGGGIIIVIVRKRGCVCMLLSSVIVGLLWINVGNWDVAIMRVYRIGGYIVFRPEVPMSCIALHACGWWAELLRGLGRLSHCIAPRNESDVLEGLGWGHCIHDGSEAVPGAWRGRCDGGSEAVPRGMWCPMHNTFHTSTS